MKKLFSIATLGLAAVTSAYAAPLGLSDSKSFTVDITLTPACKISTPGNISMAYTAFATGVTPGSSDFTVQCTNTLPFKLGLNSATTPVVAVSKLKTDNAIEIAYDVKVTDSVGAPLAANDGTGTGGNQDYKVKVYIGDNQAGKCDATGVCKITDSYTLYVSY